MAGLGLAEAFSGGAIRASGGHGPLDDFWYGPVSAPSATGLAVTEDTAFKSSAFRAAVAKVAETIAQSPLVTYRRLQEGGKERAVDHPLFPLLHDQPNEYQSSGEFVELLQVHALVHGDGYAQILLTPRGFVDQLIPIHPKNVRVETYSAGGWHSGSLRVDAPRRYQIRTSDGLERPFNYEDIFHLSGFSVNGVTGVGLLNSAKETIALALALEKYAALFFGQGARPSFALKTPGKLDRDDAQNLKDDVREKLAGLKNMHGIAILEEGLEPVKLANDNDANQFHDLRVFQVEEEARVTGVPLHMIQSTSKETSWGSGIAQMSLGFVVFTLQRHLRRWEQAINKHLVTDPAIFAEFLLDGLLRGDPATRKEFYIAALTNGWMSINEVRALENMNPIGPEGDAHRVQLNMAPAGQEQSIAA